MPETKAAPRVHSYQDGLPVYRFWDLPPGLFTPRQLRTMHGAVVGPGQQPRAFAYWRYYGATGTTPVYELPGTLPKRQCSPAQLAALERARFVLHAWRCFDCGELSKTGAGPTDDSPTGTCSRCIRWEAEARSAVDLAELAPPSPAMLPRALPDAPPGPQEWATALIESGPLVFLDTETTDLHRWVLDLAVCGLDGAPVVSSLISPGAPLAAGAVAIHGITEETLAEAEAPAFSTVLPALGRALDGATVVVYNLAYDLRCLARELHRHARGMGLEGAEAVTYARTWLNRARWVDLMEPYATWYGDWHSYWQSFTWQKLPHGNHRAAGDAAGAARLLRELAAGTAPRLPDTARGGPGSPGWGSSADDADFRDWDDEYY